MILSLIAILLVGLIIYLHYLQGLFSAGLSAVLAAVAAFVSLGYTEWVIAQVLGGKFADQAHSLVYVGLFAIVYVLLRTVFDRFIPGNVTFPLWVDRIGAGVMGLVVGVFAVGILMIATQMLPFGTSVAGMERYPTAERKAPLHRAGKSRLEQGMWRELDQKAFLEGRGDGLLLPVDQWVVSLLSHVSGENGALSAGRPFASVHPDYLREIFGQQAGLQSASRKTALTGTNSVAGVYVADRLPQFDPERLVEADGDLGARGTHRDVPPEPAEFKQGAEFRPEPEQMLLIVRTRFGTENVEEKSGVVSFAPGGIRLVAGGRNYWPVGVVEANSTLFVHHIDDPLFIKGGEAADLAFVVQRDEVLANPAEKANLKLKDDVFIEVKRLDRVDLGGKPLKPLAQAPKEEKTGLIRKENLASQMQKLRSAAGIASVAAAGSTDTPAGTAQQSAAPAATPLTYVSAAPQTGLRFARGLNVGGAGANEKNGSAAWGGFALRDNKFATLQMDPVETVQRMEMGQPLVAQFAVPDGQMMVQVLMRSDGSWSWAGGLPNYELVDGGNARHKAVGFVAKLQKDNQVFLAARFNPQSTPEYAPSGEAAGMNVGEVMLLFLLPAATNQIKTIDFGGKPVGTIGMQR